MITKKTDRQRGLEHLDRASRYQAQHTRAAQEIGPLPEVEQPKRRKRCEKSFSSFCKTYFAEMFALPWSPDHRKVIAKIEKSILGGGLFALAMPRGSGKSTLCEAAAIWAILFGHKKFPFLIAADQPSAEKMLGNIKSAIEFNDELYADFPEVCHPIRSLEGTAHKARGQRLNGERTHIEWTAKSIVLPRVEGSIASGTTLHTSGITGSFRGKRHRLPNNEVIRPDLVLLDDPQTDASSHSRTQTDDRESIIRGAVLGLAGPNTKISGLCACTIITEDDLSHRLLNRERSPEWQGETTSMVVSWPKNVDLWDEYREVRARGLREGKGFKPANAFYRANKKQLDAGFKVSWKHRMGGDCSPYQYAMNLRYDMGDAAFFAEYMNAPLNEQPDDEKTVTYDDIINRVNGVAEETVPDSAQKLTAFVDVQQSCLWYMVVAWEPENFSGHVIKYGAYPEPGRKYFRLKDIKNTLARVHDGDHDSSLYAGLSKLVPHLIDRPWAQVSGTELYVEAILVDAAWGKVTEVIREYCRDNPWNGRIIPSFGRSVTAGSKPITEWRAKPGDRIGLNWMLTGFRQNSVRHVVYDTNWWKTFTHNLLETSLGKRGVLRFFEAPEGRHRMLCEQLTSEFRVRTTGRNRRVDEWKLRPGQPDNHLWDCLVGNTMAASILGIEKTVSNKAKKQQAQTKRKAQYHSL